MRCYCCNTPDAEYIRHFEEYLCDECLASIEETVAEDEGLDLDDIIDW